MRTVDVLLVDDDGMVLRLVERMLGRSGGYSCATAKSGEEALVRMAEQSFDVVVSDMNMPAMDGADLLQKVHDLYPETVRMAFSGTTDTDIVLRTVGTTHQFFSKPEDLKRIESSVRRALSLQELLPCREVRRTVSAIERLPSLPDVYVKLEHELAKRDASIARAGRLIEEDVAMSAKVLQLVNSAFFGLREHVSSPHQAASLLGINTLKSLVLMVHVFSEWKGVEVGGLSLSDLWAHSMAVASISRTIVSMEKADRRTREDIFMGGLFHDLGKLVLAGNMPDEFSDSMAMASRDGVSAIDAERECIGASHSEAGAYLLGLWGFPDDIVEACAFHHSPAASGCEGLTAVLAVHVADVLEHEFRSGCNGLRREIDADYLEKQGLRGRLDDWRCACEGLSDDHSKTEDACS